MESPPQPTVPDSPQIDYLCKAYRQQLPVWELLDAIYAGDRAWLDYKADGTISPKANAKRFLPQLPGESNNEYHQRLVMSHFSDKFAKTCRDFMGLVFSHGVRLVDVPKEILDHWESLDGIGTRGDRLCAHLGVQALRLGHTFCLVDYPQQDDSVVSLADAINARRHPYWQPYSNQQVINWRYRRVNGRNVLAMAIIRYSQTLPQGPYGETDQDFYLKLTPGRFDTYLLERDRSGNAIEHHLPERSGIMGRRERGQIVPFDHIPLVCLYGGDRGGFFQSNPTLFSLAKLNLIHYQVTSDHRQKMHYCCFPSPVRTGGQGEDMTLGPRRIVDVPLGGSFNWVEPNSQSLAMSRLDIKDIEQEMDFLGADYLIKPGDRQAALTSQIGAKKIESELYLFASDFATGITECLRHHAYWLGLPYGGHAELETKFFDNLAADPQLLLAYSRLKELEVIDSGELRELAQKTKFFPETFPESDTG